MQTLLNLHHAPSYAPQDFLVSSANEQAYAWIQQWPAGWNSPCSILWGEEGCGKTHLAHIWAQQAHAHMLSATAISHRLEQLFQASSNQATAWVLEDVPTLLASNAVAQEDLFHLINICQQHHMYLLMTASQPASRWDITLKDLSSRLNAAPSMHIKSPDDALLRAVLIKLFSDRQLHVSDDIIDYILVRIDRKFQDLQHICTLIDRASLQQKRKINLHLVKDVLLTIYSSTY
jgi:DnaA regulatory inactivator Hda